MFKPRPESPATLGFGAALLPVATLVGLLALSFYLFGDSAALGPNQIALVFSALVAMYIAWRHGHTVEALGAAAVASVTTAISALFILLGVGALIGTWALSGTLMAMVYYGLQLLNPDYFYVTSCVICAVVAVSIGSSWTVAGTIGIGLMGVAESMGLSPAITAGAVISGAYFGDKSSPLSDTANLACAAAGSNLYDHVKESLWTSVPALLLAFGIFLTFGSGGEFDTTKVTTFIDDMFHPSVWHFLPLLLVLVLAVMRWPPFVTIFIGALAGGVMAALLAPERAISFADATNLPGWLAIIKGVWAALATGYVSNTGFPAVDTLLTRGGMSSMLSTVWLILVALAFGGIVEKAGILERLLGPLIAAAKSTGALVGTVAGAAITTNVLASDQYIAIVLPGRMMKPAFEKRGLAPVVLSRALGDSATVTSPLIPWNSCGAYMAATLGVGTIAFAPYCFFNLLNPLVSVLFAILGIRMLRAPGADKKAA
jgi:Na+:H+ antiporter, NhaC family